MRRTLIILLVLVVAKKSRTFSSSPCSANEEGCRSWEGAQPGSQPKLASGNIPYDECHAQFMNEGWPGGRKISAILFFMSANPLLSRSSKLFRDLAKFVISSFCEKNCIVYTSFCIFIMIIVIIITIISSISISFFVLLNCLDLKPRVFPSVHFSSPSHSARGCPVCSCPPPG